MSQTCGYRWAWPDGLWGCSATPKSSPVPRDRVGGDDPRSPTGTFRPAHTPTLVSATRRVAPPKGVTVDQRGLVERAKRGDHDAFVALIDLSLARLDAAAWLILRDAELARDAVQDAMVRAWRDLPGLRDPDRFGPWLHRLTVNACLDQVRRRRRRVIEVELTPLDHPAVADSSATARGPGPPRPRAGPARARAACRRRPSLLPRALAAGDGSRARHPHRDRQVPPPSVARADAHQP